MQIIWLLPGIKYRILYEKLIWTFLLMPELKVGLTKKKIYSLFLLLLSCQVVSNSLWPYGLQYTRLPCPSLSPRVCSNSCPLNQGCYPTISSSVSRFSSCPQSFPAFTFLWQTVVVRCFFYDLSNRCQTRSASVNHATPVSNVSKKFGRYFERVQKSMMSSSCGKQWCLIWPQNYFP